MVDLHSAVRCSSLNCAALCSIIYSVAQDFTDILYHYIAKKFHHNESATLISECGADPNLCFLLKSIAFSGMSTSSRTNGITAAVIAFTIALDIAALIYMHKRCCASITVIEKSFEEELQKEKELREKERIGRISVQKKTRDRLTEQSLKLGYQYRPIGFVESPFPDRRGTPRQPVLVPAAVGKIRFDKTIIQFEHFKEIIQFSHIWVLFVFHENTNGDTEASQLPARIKPPRLGGLKVGCLTTRSPHRPNNIGLSVCEVVEVGSDYITISGIDMVDGTPVIDIKPYIPYDSIQLETKDGDDTESVAPLPMSVAASYSNCDQPHDNTFKERRLTVPSWIIDSDIPLLPVNFNACALESLNELIVDRLLIHCTTNSHAIDLITQVQIVWYFITNKHCLSEPLYLTHLFKGASTGHKRRAPGKRKSHHCR